MRSLYLLDTNIFKIKKIPATLDFVYLSRKTSGVRIVWLIAPQSQPVTALPAVGLCLVTVG